MLIGSLGLGMLLGMLTGTVALVTGQTLLTAFWLYASVGILTTLTVAAFLYGASQLHRCVGNMPESSKAQ